MDCGIHSVEPLALTLSGFYSLLGVFGGHKWIAEFIPLNLSSSPYQAFLLFWEFLVGTNGLEPSTSRLSGVRSNHLSYAPVSVFLSSLLAHAYQTVHCVSSKHRV